MANRAFLPRSRCLPLRSLVAGLALIAGSAGCASSGGGEGPMVIPRATADTFGDPLPDGAVWRLGTRRLRRAVAGEDPRVTGIAFSGDGRFIAVTYSDGPVTVWRRSDGRLVAEWNEGGPFTSVALSRDGELVALGLKGGKVGLWDRAEDKTAAMRGKRGSTVDRLELSGDGERLVARWTLGDDDDKVGLDVYDLAKRKLTLRLTGGKHFDGRAFDVGTSHVALQHAPGLDVRELKRGRKDKTFRDTSDTLAAIEIFGADGRMIRTVDENMQIRLFDRVTGSSARLMATAKERSTVGAIAPNGDLFARLVAGGRREPNRIVLWDLSKAEELRPLEGPIAADRPHIVFSPDSTQVAAVDARPVPQIWTVADGSDSLASEGPVAPIRAMALAPQGPTVATLAADGELRVWDVGTGSTRWRVKAHVPPRRDAHWHVAYAPDASTLATVSGADEVKLWSVADGKALGEIRGDDMTHVAFSADGKQVLAVEKKRIWRADWAPGKEASNKKSAVRLRSGADFFAVLPSGPIAVNRTLVDPATGKAIRKFEAHGKRGTEGIAIAASGKAAVSWGKEGTLKLSTGPEGEQVSELETLTPAPRIVAISADGTKVAAVTGDRGSRITVFDGRQRLELAGHDAPISALAFAPGGQTLVSASEDMTVLFWELAPPEDEADADEE